MWLHTLLKWPNQLQLLFITASSKSVNTLVYENPSPRKCWQPSHVRNPQPIIITATINIVLEELLIFSFIATEELNCKNNDIHTRKQKTLSSYSSTIAIQCHHTPTVLQCEQNMFSRHYFALYQTTIFGTFFYQRLDSVLLKNIIGWSSNFNLCNCLQPNDELVAMHS